jgi:purine-nucleoside phosphorylase
VSDEAGARIAEGLAARGLRGADVALVLGSGLGGFAERLAGARAVPFAELPGMPQSGVPGHAGRFVEGELGGARVLVQAGRAHLYEGYTGEEVTRGVRAMAALGVRALVLTNAAGGLRRAWPPGTLMRVEDHLNLTGTVPPASRASAGSPYDAEAGAALARAAERAGVGLESGVYAGLAGPAYETPAEVRMLAWMGADAVGMSTVLEALAAAAAGLRVAALACITNHAAGLGSAPLAHADVLAAGRAAAERIERLLAQAILTLAA